MRWLKNHPLTVGGAAVGGGVILYLAFAVFGVHTLFIDDEVNESGPVFASGAAPSGLASDAVSEQMADEMTVEMANEPVAIKVDEDMPEMEIEPTTVGSGEEAEAIIKTLFTGDFVDRSHPTSGIADVLNDGSAQRFLRFEDFETDNGPDLHVYLSTAPAHAATAACDDDFIDLGDLKGNIGSQNYEIPVGIDLDRYSTVVIWCVRFGVAFGAAELSAS